MTDALLQHPLWPDAEPARNDMPLSAAPSAAATRRNWIAVACAQHARRGCATPGAGYMQVCHGKVAPLQRIRPGDRVAYYAPTVTMGEEPVQGLFGVAQVPCREGLLGAVRSG